MKKGIALANFQIDTFCGYVSHDEAQPKLRLQPGAYDQIPQSLSSLASSKTNEADFCLVWALPERLFSQFRRLLDLEPVSWEDLENEVDLYLELVRGACAKNMIVHLTFQPGLFTRGLGADEMHAAHGVEAALGEMNSKLVKLAQSVSNLKILNGASIYSRHMMESFNPKVWYLSKNPFTNAVYKRGVQELKALARVLWGGNKKLLIMDLDDTLWGGIVGDDGWQNLRLGGHDAVGEAFQDLQREIRRLKNRGVVLAIVSKNDERIALEALDRHPEMILKRADFACYRINWDDKAQNIAEVLKELNLTASAAVFLDDNPVERQRVRDVFADIEVPELPADKTGYRSLLASLCCFDGASATTDEDRRRTELYQQEKVREASRAAMLSHDEWLESLQTKVVASVLSREDLERTSQLFNKTNQMNLSTRRMTAEELWAWAHEDHHRLFTFRVSDKFGDSGLTGILGLEHRGKETWIVDFILSCRVMGRKVEERMLALACEEAAKREARTLRARYLATEKNKPCYEFFSKAMAADGEGVFFIDLTEGSPPSSRSDEPYSAGDERTVSLKS
jgi:FkbH-like protein